MAAMVSYPSPPLFMHQYLLEKYTRPFRLIEAPSRPLQPHEVRIRTAFAGLSFTDHIIQQGLYQYQKQHFPLPYAPGFEASGEVVEVGSTVTTSTIGDRVIVLRKHGCLSEEIVTTPETIITLPTNANLKLAASLPVNYLTAFHALHNIVNIPENAQILVTSAAGGVGGMLVQLAARSHIVTGIAGTSEKESYIKSLGATGTHTQTRDISGATYDVVVDASGRNVRQLYRLLKPNGSLILYGLHDVLPRHKLDFLGMALRYLSLPSFTIPSLLAENKTVSAFNIIRLEQHSPEYRDATTALLHEFTHHPEQFKHTIHTFPFTDIQSAFDCLLDRNRVGKVVLECQ